MIEIQTSSSHHRRANNIHDKDCCFLPLVFYDYKLENKTPSKQIKMIAIIGTKGRRAFENYNVVMWIVKNIKSENSNHCILYLLEVFL